MRARPFLKKSPYPPHSSRHSLRKTSWGGFFPCLPHGENSLIWCVLKLVGVWLVAYFVQIILAPLRGSLHQVNRSFILKFICAIFLINEINSILTVVWEHNGMERSSLHEGPPRVGNRQYPYSIFDCCIATDEQIARMFGKVRKCKPFMSLYSSFRYCN